MDRMLGQLFAGYVGMPLLSAPCDTDTCEKSQVPHVSFECWFPLGFCWSQVNPHRNVFMTFSISVFGPEQLLL